MHVIRLVGWVACCIYSTIPAFWLVIHPLARKWRDRKAAGRPVYQVLLPAWIGMWVIAGLLTSPWHMVVLYQSWLAVALGVLLIGTGIVLYVMSGRGFSSTQLSGQPEIHPEGHEQRLVVAGIRQRVRHPIYLGHLLEMLGWCLAGGILANFLLLAFTVVTGTLMIRLEEKELIERFGADYSEYQSRVPAIVPRAW